MYITNLSVSDYVERFYRVEINASHIKVTDSRTGVVLYRRGNRSNGLGDGWYDEGHIKIVNAMRELESAINDAVDSESSTSISGPIPRNSVR